MVTGAKAQTDGIPVHKPELYRQGAGCFGFLETAVMGSDLKQVALDLRNSLRHDRRDALQDKAFDGEHAGVSKHDRRGILRW
jgi:hypothetical protein